GLDMRFERPQCPDIRAATARVEGAGPSWDDDCFEFRRRSSAPDIDDVASALGIEERAGLRPPSREGKGGQFSFDNRQGSADSNSDASGAWDFDSILDDALP
ncbi:hypothetical protein CYMTET_46410, partial [Cymbomonas tetramitiformis]